jgi:hypothetical protein
MLYPVAPEITLFNHEGILTLLAAATKYDMDSVQSFIRAEVSRRGLLSFPPGVEFHVYAVAYSRGLVPELETAACGTLCYPLTFERVGKSLRSFEGGALRDLADFRLRSMGNFSSNFKSLSGRPSKIWKGCPAANGRDNTSSLPPWLDSLLSRHIRARSFTETIPTSAKLHDRYMVALQNHVKAKDCKFCMKVHILEGEKYCEKLRDISTQARNVPGPGERSGTPDEWVEWDHK